MSWTMLLLAACNPYPEQANEPTAGADTGATTVTIEGCTEQVLVPQVDGSEGPLAEAHAEVFGPEPEPFQVRLQWPGTDPSTSAGFLWRTDLDTLATVVEYGVGDALTERIEGRSFTWGGSAGGEGIYRIHEVRLCGRLEPGTTYSYRVGGDGHWSPTHQFTTPGAPGSFDSFRVAMAGDSRGAYETWGTVVAAMDSHDPDLLLFSGDMVDLGVNQEEWDAWFAATGDVLTRKVLLPAHGNHEFLAAHYFAQFALPGTEEWYTVRYGDLQIVSLNDTVRSSDHRSVDQVAFMDEVFGASDAPWRLAMHHQSLYSACTRHGSEENLREDWEPVYDRHEVDLVLAGHNHIYERSVPIRAGAEVAEGEGTVYLVSGGAGAPLYTEVADEWFNAVANPIEHYVIADFGPDGVDVVVRDLGGNVLDEFTIPR